MYPFAQGVQLTRAPGRSAWGVPFPSKVSHLMAEHPPPIQFEDVPLDEATPHRGGSISLAPLEVVGGAPYSRLTW
jgi:hypothetical protein